MKISKNLFEHSHIERAVLSLVLQNPDLLLELDSSNILNVFNVPINRELILVLVNLYNEGFLVFDPELIYNCLLNSSKPLYLAPDQLEQYIRGMFKAKGDRSNFGSYIKDLEDVYIKARLHDTLQSQLHLLMETHETTPARELLGKIQTDFYRLDDLGTSANEPIDVAIDIRQNIMSRLHNPDVRGIGINLPILSQSLIGWLPHKFYFIAARPKAGKSALLLQSAVHAAYFCGKKNVKVLYLDTEIGVEEFQERLISYVSRVNHMKILEGTWDDDQRDFEAVENALKIIERNQDMLYHEYVPGFNPAHILNLIRKFVYNHGVELVIFDYIKEPGSEARDRNRRTDQIIKDFAYALKDTAGVLGVPILSALQQNRRGEGVSRVGTDVAAESDGVFQACDIGLMLNKKTAKEINEEQISAGTHRLQIYGRYARPNYVGINLRYYGYCYTFVEATDQPTYDVEEQTEYSDKPEGLLGSTES